MSCAHHFFPIPLGKANENLKFGNGGSCYSKYSWNVQGI